MLQDQKCKLLQEHVCYHALRAVRFSNAGAHLTQNILRIISQGQNTKKLTDLQWRTVGFWCQGARSEISAPLPDLKKEEEDRKNGRPKTSIGHFQK